jgi:uncharacterized protein
MEHIPHELPDAFPTEKHLIERLTKTNYEFSRTATWYDDVNPQIHRIESEDEPTSDEVLERYARRTDGRSSKSHSTEAFARFRSVEVHRCRRQSDPVRCPASRGDRHGKRNIP